MWDKNVFDESKTGNDQLVHMYQEIKGTVGRGKNKEIPLTQRI